MVLGIVLIGRGAMLYSQTDSSNMIQNWIAPSSFIPGNAYMWTWGVEGSANNEPDLWHFHVMFVANDTAQVLLMWNLNESILFERSSSKIDEIFDARLPRTNQHWRWDWLIRNPHSSGISVENFTVTHYSVRYPERLNGIVAVGTGLFFVIATASLLFYFNRRRIQLNKKLV